MESDDIIEQFITARLTPPPPESEAESVETFVRDAGKEIKNAATEKAAKTGNKKAKKLKDDKEAQEAALVEAAKIRQDFEEASVEQVQLAPPETVSSAIAGAGTTVNRLADWLATRPTPGGIGVMIAVIIFFLWAIVPVNAAGETRLYLLWGVLTGQKELMTATGSSFGQPTQGNQGQNQITQSGVVAIDQDIPSITTPVWLLDLGGNFESTGDFLN